MTNSNTSVSGYLGRFLDHVGKHVVTLMKERVLQDWLNEIKAQLDSSTLLIDYGPEDLARIFEDILTLIQFVFTYYLTPVLLIVCVAGKRNLKD